MGLASFNRMRRLEQSRLDQEAAEKSAEVTAVAESVGDLEPVEVVEKPKKATPKKTPKKVGE